MNNRYVLIIFLFFAASNLKAQNLKVFDTYDGLYKEILSDTTKVYVVNFWATWCGPCIKELPYFEKLNLEKKNVKVVLLSLDFKNQIDSKLLPFLKKKSIKSEVALLTDTNYNAWLHKVDPGWTGSIPATLIIKNSKKSFVEKFFSSYKELENHISTIIN